jgi:hypothetical protein
VRLGQRASLQRGRSFSFGGLRWGRRRSFIIALRSADLELLANLLGDIRRDGTRVRLFFRDAVAGQQVNNCFSFDLELAGQFVDAYLICVVH